jgi:hypothetical protein
MLTIVKVIAATLLRVACIAINRDDLTVVALVFVGDFEDIPGIGVSGRVGEPLVVKATTYPLAEPVREAIEAVGRDYACGQIPKT